MTRRLAVSVAIFVAVHAIGVGAVMAFGLRWPAGDRRARVRYRAGAEVMRNSIISV
jgi:hypothetical protein